MNDITIYNQDNNNLTPNEGFNTNLLIDQFLADTQNLMENSKKRYKKSLKKYFEWVKKSPYQLKDITLTELLIYKSDLEKQINPKTNETLSAFTVSAYLTAVKIFYEWANAKGLLFNPAKSLSPPKKSHKFRRLPLNQEQIEQLFEYFKKISIRDYAIAKIMYYCGLRTVEISRIDIGDIEIIDGVRQVNIMGKGKVEKDNFVKLRDVAYEPIEAYLKTRTNLTKDSPVFVSESVVKPGTRLIPGTISKIIKSGLRAIGLDSKKYTAHGIRHSSATNAIKKGATIQQVQQMLRHSDEKTTLNYIYTIRDEERRNNKSAEDFL